MRSPGSNLIQEAEESDSPAPSLLIPPPGDPSVTVLKWISRTLFGLAGIAACWGAWYVVYQDSLAKVNQELPEEKKSKLAVEVVSARQDTIDDRIVLVGSLYPVSQTDVRNRAQGYVVSLPVRVGDQVQVGDTLVLLDDESQREAVTQATAALNVARAQLFRI